MLKRLLIASAISIAAFSCSEYECTEAELRFGLVGFSDAEFDTIIIKQFVNASMIDSAFISHPSFMRNMDTVQLGNLPSISIMEGDYQYEIHFPGAGKKIRISDIQEEQRSIKKRGKAGCMNRVISYKMNGQLVSDIPEFNFTYFIR